MTALYGMTAGLIIAIYYPTFRWMFERYTSPDSYYSHGFIVPFACAYLIWLRRHELRAITRRYEPMGLALIVFALSMHLLCYFAGVYFLSGYTLLFLVFGLSLYFFGRAVTRKVLFPLLLLVYMFPLPLVAINAISFPMRMYATEASVFLINLAGLMPVSNDGFRILLPNSVLIVGNPCSGLRSLIALLALGSIFAYMLKAGKTNKIALVLLAVPVAFVSNIVRIILLCAGTYLMGSASVSGFFHDAAGYLVYLIAFTSLLACKRLLENSKRVT